MGRPKITVWGWGSKVKAEGRPQFLGHLGGAAHQGAVAIVDPIKEAQSDHSFFLFQLLYTSKKLFDSGEPALVQAAQARKAPSGL